MYLSLSKTIAKFGGFRIGLRMTKKNSIWMLFLLMFVYLLQAMWYLMILCFWLIYVMIYGIVYCIKKIINRIKKKENKRF